MTANAATEQTASLVVRLFGPLTVLRAGVPVALPPSRKVRALLAYLALSRRPVARSRLCDLLWDVPNDPRGELRWCLSKLRAVLDGDRARVVATSDTVALDLEGCHVDALELDRAADTGLDQLDTARVGELCDLVIGDPLAGLDLDDNTEFTAWLTAQRNRYRARATSVLNALVSRAPCTDETFRRLETWLQLAPFDPRAHRAMLDALLKSGRARDAETHFAATIRAFEQECVDWQPLREAWRELREAAAPAPRIDVSSTPIARARRRASIAVMPFQEHGARTTVADGMTEDVIMQLAKVRVLFVIARGTAFALAERGVSGPEAGRILNVDYVVSGSVRREPNRLSVAIELSDVADDHIVWADSLVGADEDAFRLIDRAVAAIAEEVESAEIQRVLLKPPSSLDAWEAYHRGLWHMYKFNGPDNRAAEQFFRDALRLDPTFARAHAGLSFTHFQNAFLDLTPDHDRQIELAFETAGQSLSADDHDPAAHWAMGRALWLRGEQQQSLGELERSIELSPNFALGHYTLGFVHSQSGDPRAAIESTNYSRQLSPFDPLLFGMLASRALAHVRLGEYQEAADWAVKAAARPNAHTHILAIAAHCLALAQRRDEGRKIVARIRERSPSYSVEDFLRAFRLEPEATRAFRLAARDLGFDR